MHESPEEIAALQALIDRSYASAGGHLLSIHEGQRRMNAERVVAALQGMCLLTLATVTADGRPLTSPVDGIFHRGAFYFSSAPDSVKMRHVRSRPQVSATYLPREELAVTVHGRATPVDVHAPEGAGLRSTLLEIYVPRYGPEWEEFLDSIPVYARIDAERMFCFAMSPDVT